MQPNLNSKISVTFSVKYNCNIPKSKLVFPLSNESYFGLTALVISTLSRFKQEYFFLGHPVHVWIFMAYEMNILTVLSLI